MKFINTIQQNWSRVALSTVVALSVASCNAQTDNQSATAGIKFIGTFIVQQERTMEHFFSTECNASYRECLAKFHHHDVEFVNKLENMILSGKLSNSVYKIGQEVRKYFSAAIGVFKQYHGKPADQAFKFKSDMDRVFSPEEAFNTITLKLQELLTEAEAEADTELITVIKQLINVLQKKKIEWNKKSSMALLAGLTKRMNGK